MGWSDVFEVDWFRKPIPDRIAPRQAPLSCSVHRAVVQNMDLILFRRKFFAVHRLQPPLRFPDRVQKTAPAPYTGDNEVPEALNLLQKAYEQLSTRKQTIESELARIEGLRCEHEAVTAQVAALDQAMKTFHHQPMRETKTA